MLCLLDMLVVRPLRLKCRSLARVLWLEVSERALRAGEGGAKSGSGISGMGIFQKLRSVKSGAH